MQESAVSAIDHLLHAGVIVRSHYGLDIVRAIVLFRRFHALEDHAACHGIGAGYVGVVERLDMVRQFRQTEFLLQFLHQSDGFLLRIELVRLLQAVDAVLFAVHDG